MVWLQCKNKSEMDKRNWMLAVDGMSLSWCNHVNILATVYLNGRDRIWYGTCVWAEYDAETIFAYTGWAPIYKSSVPPWVIQRIAYLGNPRGYQRSKFRRRTVIKLPSPCLEQRLLHALLDRSIQKQPKYEKTWVAGIPSIYTFDQSMISSFNREHNSLRSTNMDVMEIERHE